MEARPSGGFVVGLGRQFCTKRGRRQGGGGRQWEEKIKEEGEENGSVMKREKKEVKNYLQMNSNYDICTTIVARLCICTSLHPLM